MVKIGYNISMTIKRDLLISQLSPIVLAGTLLTVYLLTLAPGLTWANSGSDGGDLIAAAAIGGIAHPTGYPAYLILAKMFQMIPVGSLAYRTNLLSAVCMTLASLFLYAMLTEYLSSQGRSHTWFSGLLAGLFFGFAPLVWSQAVITEVYALHILLISILLYLLTKDDNPGSSRDRWIGLCFGLALGNHVTSVLLLPALVVNALTSRSTSHRLQWIIPFFRQSSWMLLGLAIYLVLPLRAISYPPVNWGNPQTLDGFIWLVTGQLYKQQLFIPLSSFLSRFLALAALFVKNFSLPGLYLGLLGVVYYFKLSRFYIYTFWTIIAFSFFSLQYGTVDSKLYLIPVFLCFASWIGIGLDGIINSLDQRFWMGKVIIGLLVSAFTVATIITTLPTVDASHDNRADRFVETVFSHVPKNAIIFAKGDRAVFSLWYHHFALNERSDLSVIATDLLHFPWYLDTLRMSYPSLNLSAYFPWPETVIQENPEHPICFISYVDAVQIECTG